MSPWSTSSLYSCAEANSPLSVSLVAMFAPTRWSQPLFSLLVLGLVISACSETRPDSSSWEDNWADIVAIVPDQSFLDDDPSELCQNTLASLRESEATLFPTPDESLDAPVRSWLEVAEGAFFECPPTDGGFPAAYEELDRLEAEIEASLIAGS